MSITAIALIVVISIAVGAALTVPRLELMNYTGLAGASVTLVGAAIGLASGTQQAIFVGGILALLSGLVGICIGFLAGRHRAK
jgi:hypothetical protein